MPVLLNEWLQPLWLMLLVVLIEKIWIWPDKYHPLSFARLIASNMARKVHPSRARSHFQQRLSGALAISVLLVPFVLIMALLINLAEYPQFFDALLLLIALQFQPVIKRYRQLTLALRQDKKALARNLLDALVLRQTDRLSALGIAKAAIQTLLLRFGYQYCAVLFWYLLLGGLGAVCYRLTYEFAQCWNTKLPRYGYFGQPAAKLSGLLAWLPIRLAALSFALTEHMVNGWKALGRRKANNNHTLLLALNGGALGIELGGPAYYEGRKVRLAKIGGTREIRFSDLQRTLYAVYKTQAVLLALSLLMHAVLVTLSA